MSFNLIRLLALLSLLIGSNLNAQTAMTPIQIYTRCHLQLSGKIPDANSPIYKNVNSKAITAAEGCAQIFDKAKFTTAGTLATSTDPISRSVLERIHTIHLNWFAQKYNIINNGQSLLTDTEESSLYLTRAAFFPGAKFSDSVTLATGLQGVRTPGAGSALPLMEKQSLVGATTFRDPILKDKDGVALVLPFQPNAFRIAYFHYVSDTDLKSVTLTADLNANQVAQFGALVGVKNTPAISLTQFRDARLLTLSKIRTQVLSLLKNFNIRPHFGGGLLGSQAYLLANTNLGGNVLVDGEDYIQRRLGHRVYEDLLCHQLPTLTAADVTSEVIRNSPKPFRQAASCMQCHSSMDPTGDTFRNLFQSRTGGGGGPGYVPAFMNSVPVTNPTPPEAYGSYAGSTPQGRLKFRRLLDGAKGAPTSVNISSVAQLGAEVAKLDDFYLCSAKKYYKHFTGVDVQLATREPAKSVQARHQNLVISMSQKLKSTQSLRETLKLLFGSSVYSNRDFQAREVAK